MKIVSVVAHQIYINESKVWVNQYSDSPLDITGTDDITKSFKNFISNHIKNIRLNSSTISASFLEPKTNGTLSNIRDSFVIKHDKLSVDDNGEIKTSKDYFKNTQKLSRDIKDEIKSTASKSSAILLFVIFQDDQGVGYAILKMDPRTGYSIDDEFTVNKWENILPDEDANLHKAMILRLFDSKMMYNVENMTMFVLDKQNSKGQESRYFLNEFLNAQKNADDRKMTAEVMGSFPRFLEDKDMLKDDNVAPLFNSLRKHLNNGGNFSLESNLYNVSQPYLKDEKMDQQSFIDDVSNPYLIELEKNYSSVTKSFIAIPDEVKDLVIKNKFIKITVDKQIDANVDVLIQHNEKTKETIITLKNGIGNELK